MERKPQYIIGSWWCLMARAKGKSGTGKKRPFVMLPHDLLKLPEYITLGHTAKTLLTDALMQYRGKNNGDICLTRSMMIERGWSSNDTLRKAINELIDVELLILTRQGGRNKCCLYGFTWMSIDECKNKLDIRPSSTPIKPLSLRR